MGSGARSTARTPAPPRSGCSSGTACSAPPRAKDGAGARRPWLLQPLDDAQIALGAVVEHLQRGLVFRAVVGLDRLGEALELDDDDALLDAGLVGCGSVATGDV